MRDDLDWAAIRAEYIGGGISLRALAEKYDVSMTVVGKRARQEKWTKLRKEAFEQSAKKAIQKASSVASDNALIAQRIKHKLLSRLEKEIDNLPETIGTERFFETEKREMDGGRKVNGMRYKLSDLTQSYKALTGDMPEMNAADTIEDDPLTQSLKEFAKGMESGEDNADK